MTSPPKPRFVAWRHVRDSLRFGLPLAWSSNRRLCIALGVSSLASAVAGPLLVLVLGGAVREIQTALEARTSQSGDLARWIVIAAVLSLSAATADEIRRYVRRRLEDEIQLRVDCRLIWHVAGLNVATLEEPATQDALQRATLNPGHAVLAMLLGLIDAVSNGLQAIVFLVLLLWIEPFWSLLLLGAAVPHLAARWYVSRASHQSIRKRATAKRWGAYYREILQNHRFIPEIKVMRLAPLLAQRFEASVAGVLQSSRMLYRLQAVTHLASTLISIVAVLIILSMVGQRAIEGRIALGAFVAYWTSAWRMRAVTGHLSDAVSMTLDAHYELLNIREVLGLRPTLPVAGAVDQPLQGRIELRDLTFHYPASSVPAIDNVSATIAAGECVALVGLNGAGKTTLAKLIARLYEPARGSVLIDGVDLRDWDLTSLHRQMSVVFQEPVRFEATVAENIAFGDWERLVADPALVQDVARRTGLHECIAALPDGYDTHIGRQFGRVDLSVGQWRQLAVTRGVANNPALIILDEPTANLDAYAEERFFRSIRETLRGRTAILISHRFSTLRLADRLLVIDGGRLVEQGTHDELLQRGGLYASMFHAYSARLAGRPALLADAA